METVLVTQLAVSALIVLFSALLGVWAQRNERVRPGRQILVVAVALLAVVWMPHAWVDASAALLAGLFVASRFGDLARHAARLRLAAFLAGAVVVWLALSRVIPGGASMLLALLAAGFAVPPALRALPVMLRVRRARQLSPGERPRDEVHIGGRIGREPVPPPPTLAIADPMGAWRLSWTDGRHAQPSPLEIHTPQGPVLVDLERVEVMSSEAHRSMLDSMEAYGVAKALGDAEMIDHVKSARSQGVIAPVELSWLPPGAGVYVVGRPFWRRLAGASYRDGEIVPCFEGEAGDEPALVDQSPEEHARHLTWEVLRGGGWGLLAGLIALLQLLREL